MDLEDGHRHATATPTTCCTGFFYLAGTIVFFLLIFSASFLGFLGANLPKVKVHRLDIYKFNVTKHQDENKGTQLDIDVNIMVNMSNNFWNKMTLVYGKMKVETKIEGIKLPKVHLDGFRQNPRTSNDLKIHPKEMRYKLKQSYAEKLKLTADKNKITLSLKAGGNVQFWYNGRMISKQHFNVRCDFIEQSNLHLGVAHNCAVNLGYFR
uniref:NDR1/HIN1-like protein 6 n=1 Tax=Tanacetum cinerariifolium TaxID=118510 RepID=A0A6L2NTJ6_TANCI|nr:NDR1/HIN1-like protein 6 [Tanacetum cinerariifolium]